MPRQRAGRAGLVLLVVALGIGGCRATTELGPPAATPTDMGGIALALQRVGVRVDHVVSGDAGCPDPVLAKAAIALEASGLDQPAAAPVHLFIFDDDAAYQRARPSVDACARSFVTDPATYEALDQSPYVFAGQGPWGPAFKAAVRAALRTAAQGG
ncbi:MAG TPA: hypothetical protein VEY67_06085 [Candidatus Dormibacteraeota bacterium]|nr:hypothetical protein [Candidatus Dormibacteraeota bacterium]